MSKKVLILGGAGFIGLNVSRILAKKGYGITIGDNFARNQNDVEFNEFLDQSGTKFIEEDFANPAAWDLLDKDYDYFYMLASMIGVNTTLEIPEEIIRVNTALIFNSLEWVKTTKIKNVLFTSTSECYSGTIDRFGYAIPTPEDIPLCIEDIGHPRFTYAVTKMLGESGFIQYARKYDFNCAIVRYSNIFGPRMGFNHVIPHLVQRFLNQESPYRVFGHDQTRSFCYIDDGAMGTVLAMEKNTAHDGTYHIGATDEITMEELIKEVGKYFNYDGEYVNAPTYPGSVSRRGADITKAKNELGFDPKTNWREGLKPMLDWYTNYYHENPQALEKPFKEPRDFK